MTEIKYPKTSPYYLTNMYRNSYLDVMVNVSLSKLSDDVYWTILPVYNYRPDLLAYDLYNDSRLWWVFANRNPNVLKDPLFDFLAGVKIYLPKMDTLQRELGI
jgi:hypothetical protein